MGSQAWPSRCSSSSSFGTWISVREIKEIMVSNDCEKLCPPVKTEGRDATSPLHP